IAKQLFSLAQRGRIVLANELVDTLYGSIDRQQVEPAIVVDVEPCGAESGKRQAWMFESGRRAAGLERASSIVDIQIVALTRQVRHKDILIPVIVKVAGIHTHAGFGCQGRSTPPLRQAQDP